MMTIIAPFFLPAMAVLIVVMIAVMCWIEMRAENEDNPPKPPPRRYRE